jgi:hypothetical protein
MADLVVMAVGNCFHHVTEDALGLLLVNPLALLHAPLKHLLPRAILHYKVKLFRRLEDFVEAHHIGMVNVLQDADFVYQPHRILHLLFPDDLDSSYRGCTFLSCFHYGAELPLAHRMLLIELVVVLDSAISFLDKPLAFNH